MGTTDNNARWVENEILIFADDRAAAEFDRLGIATIACAETFAPDGRHPAPRQHQES
ncbi:MAG: hypothetical protein JWM78_363 [Verrucomicrobiaceae bacterium]|nr:hypothetical protein [Verrucomicrobiaceae bacterium]